MKKLLSMLAIIAMAVSFPACSSDDDEPEQPQKTLMDLDLSNPNSIIGDWTVTHRRDNHGEYVEPYDAETWSFSVDGTCRKGVGFAGYTQGTYEYTNGVALCKFIYYGVIEDNYKLEFSHYDKGHLKMVKTQIDTDLDSHQLGTYLIRRASYSLYE